MAMNINLTPQLEEKDQMRAARLAQLRQEIQDGLDSGPTVALDVAALKGASRAKRKAKSSGEA